MEMSVGFRIHSKVMITKTTERATKKMVEGNPQYKFVPFWQLDVDSGHALADISTPQTQQKNPSQAPPQLPHSLP